MVLVGAGIEIFELTVRTTLDPGAATEAVEEVAISVSVPFEFLCLRIAIRLYQVEDFALFHCQVELSTGVILSTAN